MAGPPVKAKPAPFDPGSAKAKAVKAEVAALIPKGVQLPEPAVPKPTTIQLLKAFRDFASGTARFAELTRIFPNFAGELAGVLKRFNIHPTRFGCKTVEEVRDRIFAYLSEFGIRAETKAEFLAKSGGYKSNLNGEITEWLIRNDVGLTKDVHTWAVSETAELNRVVLATRGRSAAELANTAERIVDATGKPVLLPQNLKFGDPVRVTDIWIDPPKGSPKKFVDDMEVTLPVDHSKQLILDPLTGDPSCMAPAVMGQFKFRYAIRKAARQAAEDPSRMAEMSRMRFTYLGTEYAVPPGKVLFVAQYGDPQVNQYVVASSDLLAHPGTPKPAYASSIDDLLGAERPQVTPFSKLVPRPGGDVRVRGVMVELALGSNLVQSISDLVYKP